MKIMKYYITGGINTDLDEAGPRLDGIDVSLFEESSNGSDTGSWGSESDDLGCSEPSAELYHDNSTCFGAQGDFSC